MTGTQVLTVAVAILGPGLLLGMAEWWTLSDDTPENHITASFRALLKTDLGVLVWTLTVLVYGVIAGHIWSSW